MSTAICDPKAFYPFRSLVTGPIRNFTQLAEIERFVRTVVLHDEIVMELEPWPFDPDSDELHREINPSGKRNVIVAMGPVLDGYDFFTEHLAKQKDENPETALSPKLVAVAKEFSCAGEGNAYFEAHVRYLQNIVRVVQKGGSALLSGDFGTAAIDASSKYPEKLFEVLDRDWKELAQEAHRGEIGLVVPPVLSIVLTRCARRNAIPAVLKDLRDEWATARSKVWALISGLNTARTVREIIEIQQELKTASLMLSPKSSGNNTKPGRVLWDLVIGGAAGAVAGSLVSGNPPDILTGLGAALGAASKSISSALHESGPALFGRGAFDLARRVRKAVFKVEINALSRILKDSERQQLGI